MGTAVQSNAERGKKAGEERLPFIDGMRGLAVLLMIAVHVTDAFLAVAYRDGVWWSRVDILFGFVAPAFVFFSGVTLFIAVRRRRESGRSLWALALRALLILALGYWLHIPSHSLPLALEATPAQRARFFDCDILQLISVSMLFTLGLAALLRNPRRSAPVALGIGAVVAAVAPVVFASGFADSLPVSLFFYFSPAGSFPLFPYAAYFLIGYGASAFLADAAEKQLGPLTVSSVGVGMVFIGYLLHLLLLSSPPYDDFWGGSPAQFLFRLGGVLLITGGMMWLGKFREKKTWLEEAGRASLAIYVLHLMLVYGSPVTMGMRYWFDSLIYRALNPWQSAALFAAVTVAVWFAVDAWRWFAGRYPEWGRRVFWGWWIGFGVVFLATGW